jgi:hypothetical protein
MLLFQPSIIHGLADPNQQRVTGRLVFIGPGKEAQ